MTERHLAAKRLAGSEEDFFAVEQFGEVAGAGAVFELLFGGDLIVDDAAGGDEASLTQTFPTHPQKTRPPTPHRLTPTSSGAGGQICWLHSADRRSNLTQTKVSNSSLSSVHPSLAHS
ncbi:MAG: hypothetical protein WEB31_07405 [Chthoniobacterales bacterium]